MAFHYRLDVLDALLAHGVRPTESTRPELVHEFVSDLYRYEIRRLRGQLLANDFPKKEYAGRVIELRMRYRVISMRAAEWLAEHG
jgi:hypothetical protein